MAKHEALHVGAVCLGLHLKRAARRVARTYDDALAPLDLTIGQFSLLTVLAGQESWSMQPLADVLGTDRSSLTAMLKPLERRKLVESQYQAAERRSRQLNITPIGLEILQSAMPLWTAAQARTVEHLGADDAAAVRTILNRLR